MEAPERIEPNLEVVRELKELTGGAFKRCGQCATCTIVCDLSAPDGDYPRGKMLWAQWGLKDRLLRSLEPWLCYYCGKCSQRCPRKAEPGETLMGLRRWLTSRYDVTGISSLLYRSWKAELLVLFVVALTTALGLLAYGFGHGNIRIYDGAQAFLSSAAIHRFDWAMAGVLTLFLGINAARMWWFTMVKDEPHKAPLASYLRQLPLLPLHFITQKRFSACDSRRPWAIHLVLMLSYVSLFTLIMFFLHDMQSGPAINWKVHAIGYAASAGLLGTVIFAIRGRLAKVEEQYKHSHESDWLFLALLALVTITGVTQHALHRTGHPMEANVAYVVHLSLVVPMLLLEVPFGKWSHMVYRPLAVYFDSVRRDALVHEKVTATRPEAAEGAAAGRAVHESHA
ncbi:MAG: 4Fe-4S dicluster domain-containing protein [Acidobacteria bacterium]|nr:4Fe-4S dicluster domain-containing protein [Acidobacteriota bacterium]